MPHRRDGVRNGGAEEGGAFTIWQDVVVRLPLGDEVLASGLAAGFGVTPEAVLVHRGAADFPERGDAKIVCVVSERAEGFRSVMSLYTFLDSHLGDDPVTVVKRFAQAAGTACLLSDDSPDPYSMILIGATGEVVRVNIDVELLDAKGEYHLKD